MYMFIVQLYTNKFENLNETTRFLEKYTVYKWKNWA